MAEAVRPAMAIRLQWKTRHIPDKSLTARRSKFESPRRTSSCSYPGVGRIGGKLEEKGDHEYLARDSPFSRTSGIPSGSAGDWERPVRQRPERAV